MKTLHRWLIAAGLVLLSACTLISEVRLQEVPPTLFEQACTELRADCTNINPPIVIYSAVPEAWGALGLYIAGEKYVYINSVKHVVPWEHLVLHETVHYVAHEAGLGLTRCQSEATARVITSRVFNTEIDPEWRKRYNCPAPL